MHRNCFGIGEWLPVWLRLGTFMERYGLEKEFCGCTLRYPNMIGEHLIHLPVVFTAFLESKNGYFTHKCPT